MKNFTGSSKAGKPVCFIDGFVIRHGVALGRRRGVWRVRCGHQTVCVWEDDIFASAAQAQHVLNAILS
ncbi:MAG: hypothetical protein ACI4Q7_02365 [Candidatus Avelusimicrobium sp.]